MSLTLALQTALTGIAVNQKALAVISQNIANANTVGYTRKTVDVSSVTLGGVGAGVQIDGINRKVDAYLSSSIRSGTANSSSATTISDYLQRLQVYLGDPSGTGSLDKEVQSFFDASQSLAETPESLSMTSQVVSTGSQLANSISSLAQNVLGLRYQADQDIGAGVKGFNQTLQKLQTVNIAIAQAKTLGNPTSDLLDKRDTLLNDVSSFMDARIVTQSDGQAFVYTKNGTPLLSEQLQQLDYTAQSSVNNFAADARVNNIVIRRALPDGTMGETTGTLVVGGTEGNVDSSNVGGGSLQALLQLRDTIMPNYMTSLDQLTGTIRDQFNAIHNQGSAYPGASSYTAERAMIPSDYTGFNGQLQIAVLNADGTPHASSYADQVGKGVPPLTLDLGSINSSFGTGNPTLQNLVDEINSYYGTPQNRVTLGNLSQIQLSALSNNIPESPPVFNFDFTAQNLSGTAGKFYVSDVAVADDTGTDITNVTTTQPQVALSNTNTYTMTAGSNLVHVTTAAPHTLQNGDVVYLGDPGAGPFNGISGSELNGYFTINNVTANGFDINTVSSATGAAAVNLSGVTAMPPYDTIQTGEDRRTGASGTLTANLAANSNSSYYDFTVSYGVVQPDGTVSTGTATYRIIRDQNIQNQRFSANAVSGQAQMQKPSSSQPLMRATLVDANGTEIPQLNGKYPDVPAYLKLVSGDPQSYIALSDLNSKEIGVTNKKQGSNENFFQYFGMNNFFTSNKLVDTGDSVKNSALNFAVEKRILAQPALVSTGKLTRSNQPTDPAAAPIYTYERYKGDNSIAQAMAQVGSKALSFSQAGGLPASSMTLNGYAAQFLGYLSNASRVADTQSDNTKLLTQGLQSRSDSISGVNIDEELANTIVYQNAYTASARIISVTNQLFDTLLSSFQG